MDHGEIGAALLRKWGFPESISEPIHYRFAPMLCEERQKVVYALNLACELSERVRSGLGSEGEDWRPNRDHLEIVALDPDQVVAAAEEVSKLWDDARAFLS